MKKNILIVEDDKAVARMAGSILAGDACNILTAGSIREAETLLSGGKIDVIILDRMLPDGDGLDLFRDLKEKPGMGHIPVLILSGKDSDEDQADGLDVGADDYMTKPFSVVELKARVRALLRRAKDFRD